MKRIRFLIISVFCLPTLLFSQNAFQIPEYVPQSPTAAAYARYGEIPVDYSTGVPRIEIPIHSIKFGKITIPINISYHASGIKVRDVATEVGLGWVLNTGGVLTANIIGMPDVLDVKPFSYKKSSDIEALIKNVAGNRAAEDNLALEFDKDITKKNHNIPNSPNNLNSVDFFSDRFYYSLCDGENGVFRKDFVSGEIRFLPYRSIKIINFDRNSIVILSSNGYKYYFISASFDYWVLDKIEAPNSDVIKYYYKSFVTESYNHSYSVNWDFGKPEIEISDPYGETPCINYKNGTQSHSAFNSAYVGTSSNLTLVVDSIVYNNEGVYFDYVKDRQDIENNAGYRLSKIVVKDRKTKNNVKVYDFFQSYFGNETSENLRLRLDKVYISGSESNNENAEKYNFAYNSIEMPAKPKVLGGPYHEDYWGYYNGANNQSLFPEFFGSMNIPNFTEPLANLEPNPAFTKSCILQEIRYPTGGKTIFDYEQNCIDKTSEGGQKTYYGGLRIAKITSYTDELSKAFTKTYKYGSEYTKIVSSSEYKISDPIKHIVVGEVGCGKNQLRIVGSYESYSAFSNPNTPINFSNGASILYGAVEEFIGTEISNIGKNKYVYDFGKWEESIFNCTDAIYPQINKQFSNDFGNYQPKLLSKTVFDFKSGAYTPVKYSLSEYSEFKISEFNTGLNLGSNTVYEDWSGQGDALKVYLENFRMNGAPSYFSSLYYCDTKGHEDLTILKNTTEYDYKDGVETIFKSEDYEYDEYAQISKKTITNSSNSLITTEYKYPYDFKSNITPNVYNTMEMRNIISPVVEETKLKDEKLLQSVKNNFKAWDNGIIEPEKVDLTVNGKTETRLRFNKYDDKGNVLEVNKEDDILTSYIWGYNQAYPIIKAENADYSTLNIAFNSALTSARLSDLSEITIPSWSLSQKSKLVNFVSALQKNPTLSKALTTIYTYSPLIGMTSQTDPNGVTIYYEYDDFGRLIYIKDKDLQILKSYTYHYAGNSPHIYYNVAKSKEYTRNNCGADYNGGTITYNIAPQKYSSSISQIHADQLAQNDIDTNGQVYANTYGTCTPLPSSKVTVLAHPNPNYATEVLISNKSRSYSYEVSGSSGWLNVVNDTYTVTINIIGCQEREQNYTVNGVSQMGGCSYTFENVSIGNAINISVVEIFYNKSIAQVFTRSDCGVGYVPGQITYTVPAKKHSSLISQEDADYKAQYDMNLNGQKYANENSACIRTYYNVYMDETFTKNDCEPGYVGQDVTYYVMPKKYSSTLSQEDADDQARAEIRNNGQKKANDEGNCIKLRSVAVTTPPVYNLEITLTAGNKKLNYYIPSGYESIEIPEGTYNITMRIIGSENNYKCLMLGASTTGVLANGDCYIDYINVTISSDFDISFVEENQTITYYNKAISQEFIRNNCGSEKYYIAGSATYSVPAARHSSTISQADADSKAINDLNANGQNYANVNASCTRIYYNQYFEETFTKNDCSSGYTGGEVIYYVSSGTYSSTVSQEDADNKALEEINANGQSKANQNGSCIKLRNVAVTTPPIYDLEITLTSGDKTLKYYVPSGYESIEIPDGTYNITMRIIGSEYVYRCLMFGTSTTGILAYGDCYIDYTNVVISKDFTISFEEVY